LIDDKKINNNKSKLKEKTEDENQLDKEIEGVNGNKYGRYSKFLNEKTKNQIKRR
jgi:hypothetical protein